MKMHDCETVDLSFFETEKHCYQAVVEIKATPEQIFACFEDETSWPEWALPITHVEWFSEKPYGIGTRRRVTMTGIVGDEVFIAWDYPKQMAFCFTHSSQKLVKSFAEKYDVEPLDNGATRVTWTMAMAPSGFGKITMGLFAPIMRWSLQWMFNHFKQHVEQRYPA